MQVGDLLSLRDRKPVTAEREPVTPDREPVAPEPVAFEPVPPVETEAPDAPPRAGSASVIWPTPLGGGLARLKPMRVLVISHDRHFCSVTAMLLARRGCSVMTTTEASRIADLIADEHADVVVIDAGQEAGAGARTVAELGALTQPVGVVVVDEAVPGLHYPVVLAKWGPFEDLFAAIEAANAGRGTSGATG